MDFIEEKTINQDSETLPVHPEKNLYTELLADEEIQAVNGQCGYLMKKYGYSS